MIFFVCKVHTCPREWLHHARQLCPFVVRARSSDAKAFVHDKDDSIMSIARSRVAYIETISCIHLPDFRKTNYNVLAEWGGGKRAFYTAKKR